MATPKAGKGGRIQTFAQSTVDRIAGRVTVTVPQASTELQREAFTPDQQFFPSGMPQTPIAPAGTTTGRRFDFQSFVNMTSAPRGEAGEGAISFRTLRRLASPADGGLDLLRLAIETRKDQMSAQRWSIRGKKKDDDGGKPARDLETWLARPDGVHTFRQWMRMLLEDHFVIDAPTIYYAVSNGRPVLEIMDGATIKILIRGDDGRTPLPPLPAYQQFLKGMPAANYTIDELGYYPYNLLSYRLYGMSRVEQVVVTIRMAIERAMSQLGYYTEGTTPDGFMELPKDFTLEQVQQWTEWFNSELAGQTGERHKIRFVLQDSKYQPTKTEILKDLFDEWLARIICFNFSLSPQALVKETNRATAQTGKEAAQEEGLEPTKLWFKDVMDDALARAGYAELEWQWEDEEIVDPVAKAQVVQSYYGGSTGTAKPLVTLEEARKLLGFAPATPEQLLELQPPAPEPEPDPTGDGSAPAPNGDKGTNQGKDSTKAATSRGGRSLPPLKRNVKRRARVQARLQDLTSTILTAQGSAIAAAVRDRAEKFAKATTDDVAALIDQILAEAWDDDAREKLWALLSELSEDRAAAAMAQVRKAVDDEAYAAALTQANERAVEWARFRATNMITETNDTTRQLVNELTASTIEDGLTNTELADLLSDSFGFSDERADMIARTETAFAETAGTLEGYAASGVVEGKEWSADGEACDECAALDGVVVALDEDFPDGGGDGAPLHPNCECSVAPVLSDDAMALINEE
jgi:SPP1 gp7 family putative phage head morphogenesis protein